MKRHRTEPRPRRRLARAVVWGALVALTAAGATLADVGREPGAVVATVAPAADDAVVTDDTTPAPATTSPAASGSGDCEATGTCIGGAVGEQGAEPDQPASTTWQRALDERLQGYDYENARELLPAYRWRGNTPLSDSTGVLETISDGGISRILNGVASLFFTFAKTVWSVMLWATEYALTQSVIDGMAADVNRFFASLAAGLGGPFVFAAIAVFGMFVALRLLMRRGRGGASSGIFRLALTVVIPLATLQVLATGAQNAEGNDAPPTTSPAGLAVYANRLVNALAGGVLDAATSPFNQESVSTRAVWAPPSGSLGADMAPQCAPYVDGLYAAYSDRVVLRESYAARDTALAGESGTTVAMNGWLDKSANTMPKHMSRLWETAFLRAYLSANFGHPAAWSKAGCHFLDGVNGVDPERARSYALVYGGYDVIGEEPSARPFVMRRKPSEQIADSFIWVVCDYNTTTNAWEPRPGWAIDGIAPATCSTWWTNPDLSAPAARFDDSDYIAGNAAENAGNALSSCNPLDGVGDVISDPSLGSVTSAIWGTITRPARCLGSVVVGGVSTAADVVHTVRGGDRTIYEWGKSQSIYEDIAITEEVRAQGADAVEGKKQMEASLLTHFGASDASGIRLTEGFIAMITALIYAWVLLGLSLGALISQFGLVVMVALLPVTLVMAAIPGADGTRSQAATRMLRMTAGFLVARLVLLGAITVFIVVISLVQTAIASIMPGAEGYGRGVTAGAIFTMLAPLIALFLLRRLMSNMGLGNLMSLRSNAMLPTALARDSERREAPSLPKKAASATRSLAGGAAAGMLNKNPEMKNRKMPKFLDSYSRGAGLGGAAGAAFGADVPVDPRKRPRLGGAGGAAFGGAGRYFGGRHGGDNGPREQRYGTPPPSPTSSSPEEVLRKTAAKREQAYLEDLAHYGSEDKAKQAQATRDLIDLLQSADQFTDGTAPSPARPRSIAEQEAAAQAAAERYGLSAKNFAVGGYGAAMLVKLSSEDVQSLTAAQFQDIQRDFSYVNAGLENLELGLDGNATLQAVRLGAMRSEAGLVDESGRPVAFDASHYLTQSEYLEMQAARDPAQLRPELAAKVAPFQRFATADHAAGRARAELIDTLANRQVTPFP